MKTIPLFLLFFLVSGLSVLGQDLDEIAAEIRQYNQLDHQATGPGGSPGPNYLRFEALRAQATTDQLLAFTHDTNAVLACYAGWALVDAHYPNLSPLFERFVETNTMILCYSGCRKYETNTASEFYHYYRNALKERNQQNTDSNLLQMDSIILYKDMEPFFFAAFEHRCYPTSYLPQIEKLAFEQKAIDAQLYLNKWYKAQYQTSLKTALLEQLTHSLQNPTTIQQLYTLLEATISFNDDAVNASVVYLLSQYDTWKREEKMFYELLESHEIWRFQIE